jgi:predicted DCC family thiol-disulfide oxidoreductase YuxK
MGEALPYLHIMTNTTKVLYNNDCPVCSFEIDHYASYAKRKGLPIVFHDLNGPDLAEWDLTEDQAARRLYVLHEGRLSSGIPAFLVLWRQMPRMRWLARIVGLRGIKQVASMIYDYALAPLIYRWHLRRKAKAELRP